MVCVRLRASQPSALGLGCGAGSLSSLWTAFAFVAWASFLTSCGAAAGVIPNLGPAYPGGCGFPSRPPAAERGCRAPNRRRPMHPRQRPASQPTLINGGSDLLVRQLRFRSPANPLLQVTKTRHCSANIVRPLSAFRHKTSHWLVVTGNDDLFALGYAVEQLPEAGLGLERTYFRHALPSLKSTSH